MAAPGAVGGEHVAVQHHIFILHDAGACFVEFPVNVLGRVGRDVLVLHQACFGQNDGGGADSGYQLARFMHFFDQMDDFRRVAEYPGTRAAGPGSRASSFSAWSLSSMVSVLTVTSWVLTTLSAWTPRQALRPCSGAAECPAEP